MPSRKSSPDLVPLLIADVYELAGTLRGQGEEIARGVGQTQARWQVLSAASDGAKSVPQLARRLGVSRQNVQRIADGLVGEALARFAENPDHRTSPHLVLTEKGRSTLDRLARAARTRHVALGARLAGTDLQALRQDLRSVLSALDTNQRGKAREKDND